MNLSDVVIILSRPAEPGNVGAVCRAMKNMGLSRLALVSPAPLDEGLVRARAVHAGALWDRAERFDTLAAAVAGCSLVIGTTRRRGKRRKALTLDPAETAACLKTRPGPAALVFGNERTGLEAEELNLCSLASHIPADRAFPSLNLSHAVQIYAYELFRALGPAAPEPASSWVPLERQELDLLVRRVTDSLESLGFYKQPGREEQEGFFRDIFSRAGLTRREAQYMGDIFAKAARLGLISQKDGVSPEAICNKNREKS
ncbi:MAG: TrmJ/YjtD family RNA methyltransferase [Treponema sp.]|jgi:tRNA/rRNA methyltransferase/tRNA (cytidine32/uridine32-2'-O)-methyltransferase|nr:TrmJ/YjtD family RNA methyltransferase [Treponema sp.]